MAKDAGWAAKTRVAKKRLRIDFDIYSKNLRKIPIYNNELNGMSSCFVARNNYGMSRFVNNDLNMEYLLLLSYDEKLEISRFCAILERTTLSITV